MVCVTATQTFMVSEFPPSCSQRQSSNGDDMRNKHPHVASCTRVSWHNMTQWHNLLQTKNGVAHQTGSLVSASSSRNLPLCPGISSRCSGRRGASLRKQKQDSPLCLTLSALLEPEAALFAVQLVERWRLQCPEAQLLRCTPELGCAATQLVCESA